MEARKVKLPSGAELHIVAAPFVDSKNLYQAMLREVKGMKFDANEKVDVNFFKDLFCAGFASKEIEDALWTCFARCLINKEKITEETFEPVPRRDDYFAVCFEVAKENVMPFTKSLYAQYSHILDLLTVVEQGPA
jgi:hypothetical protein